jgi:hypothetical protein
LTEEIIVDPECYSTASCNIFNKHQLLEKERILFASINWGRIRMGALRGVKVGCVRLGLMDNLPRAEEFLSILLKQERTAEWKDSKLIYTVLSLVKMDKEQTLSSQEVVSLVEQF